MISQTKCTNCSGSGQQWIRRGSNQASVTCGECNGTGVRLQSDVEDPDIPLVATGTVTVVAKPAELPEPEFDLDD